MAKPARAGGPGRKPLVSLVVAMKDEAGTLASFFTALSRALKATPEKFEIIIVNDGSGDDTLALLLALQARDERIRIVDLSRNFGKEAALTAGLAHAHGDAVIVMDADLQDPPGLIPDMVRLWREEGYEMVIARRRSRAEDGLLKRIGVGIYVRVYNLIGETGLPDDAGDFRLLDKTVVQALLSLPERVRFNKGLFAWLGYRQAFVDFDRQAPPGRVSRWSARRLLRLALDGITSFSALPLKLWSYLGAFFGCLAMACAAIIIFEKLYFGIDVPGYASLMVAVLFMGALNMIGLGIIGEYLSRVFIEVKQRPLYLVRQVHEPGEAKPVKKYIRKK